VSGGKLAGLDAWKATEGACKGMFFGLDRNVPSVAFTKPYVPDSWLTKLRRRVGRWLLRGLNE